jgi:hypothetical protein
MEQISTVVCFIENFFEYCGIMKANSIETLLQILRQRRNGLGGVLAEDSHCPESWRLWLL